VFPQVERVPLVARRGTRVRESLTEALGVPDGKRLALLYLGGWGLDIRWPALARWDDWVFLLDAPPPEPVANVRAFDARRWRYADVAASVDAVVSKAGYGTLSECIANSAPLIYLPRHGFAEHEALVLGMRGWGGGVEIPEADFFSGDWGAALEAARRARPDPAAYATDGADVIARRLVEFCQ
jgi:L-arabinokinase